MEEINCILIFLAPKCSSFALDRKFGVIRSIICTRMLVSGSRTNTIRGFKRLKTECKVITTFEIWSNWLSTFFTQAFWNILRTVEFNCCCECEFSDFYSRIEIVYILVMGHLFFEMNHHEINVCNFSRGGRRCCCWISWIASYWCEGWPSYFGHCSWGKLKSFANIQI